MKKRIYIDQESLYFSVTIVVILFSLLSYLGYRAYHKLSEEQAKQIGLIKEQLEEQTAKEQAARDLIQSQSEALKLAQLDLTQTKEETLKQTTQLLKQNEQLNTLNQVIKEQSAATNATKDLIISSNDLAPYITGTVQVMCLLADGTVSSGSGALWNFKEVPHAVLTNYHVVKNAKKCMVSITDASNKSIGSFALEGNIYTFNKDTDTAILAIGSSLSNKNMTLPEYNYGIAKLRKCPTDIAIGSPTLIVGFPAYAKRDSVIAIEGIGSVNVVYRTTTNGILSGYDTSGVKPNGNLLNPNYFTSAKIDSGNSGGIALSKDSKGMCSLGLSTWLTVGNYENQGLIQNITNIIP